MRGVLVAIAVIGLTASFRFLALNGFPDDHYVHLAGAQQMLHGALPSRDFVDHGQPLMFVVSAAAQRIFGEGQLTEAVLMSLAFGLAAMLTLRAGVRLTGSILLALFPVVIEVLIFPRTYSYSKMVIYASAALALLWYAERPSRGRVLALALLTVVAGLVRHDHGLFLGIASLVAVALSPVPSDRFKGASVLLFCGAALSFALPYLVYLQTSEGVLAHVQRGMSFTTLEMSRQRLPLGDLRVHEVWLLAATWGAPVAALAALAMSVARRRPGSWDEVRRVGPLAVLALVANAGLIRDLPETRLPDAIVVPALIGMWLGQSAWGWFSGAGAVAVRVAAVVALVVTLWGVTIMGHTPEQLNRIGVFNGIGRLPGRFKERAIEMKRPWEGRQRPSVAVQEMRPFFGYTARCVPADARLLVAAYLPEVLVLAHRPFAGGQIWFMPGGLATADDHALVMRRLAGERVPLAVIRRPSYDDLAREFPELDAHITAHFSPIAQWSMGGDDRVVLLADMHASTGRDDATGWPCYR
ncbi:MAG TPA: hypothetical protein VKB50_24360 [Vicinamibacterales bacterium]|nr:hypothetical protein [Vicinamibacterales bacterium]